MWPEKGEQVRSLRSLAHIRTEGIKWLSGVEKYSDISVCTDLNNRETYGTVAKRRLNEQKEKG